MEILRLEINFVGRHALIRGMRINRVIGDLSKFLESPSPQQCRELIEATSELSYTKMNVLITAFVSVVTARRRNKLSESLQRYMAFPRLSYYHSLWYHPEDTISVTGLIEEFSASGSLPRLTLQISECA